MSQFSWIFGDINNVIWLSGLSMELYVSDVGSVIQRMGWGPGVMGKLRRAGRKEIHSWPWPLCIIVPFDPVNILNHKSKHSDPPVNTQGEAPHRSVLRYCCPSSQAWAANLKSPYTHGLRLINWSWVAGLFKIDVGSIHIWCYHYHARVPNYCSLSILSMLQLNSCESKTERIEGVIQAPCVFIMTISL